MRIEDKLKIINDTQIHRGPDIQDYYTDQFVGLCHTRLSIIDLSENARQPFILHFAGRPHEIVFFKCRPHESKNLIHLIIQIHNKPLYLRVQGDCDFSWPHVFSLL